MRIITTSAAAIALTCATSVAHATDFGNYESPIFAMIDWGIRAVAKLF